MSTLADIRADLRAILRDEDPTRYRWTDAYLGEAINRGISLLWPQVFVVKTDTSQQTSDATLEHDLPADYPDTGGWTALRQVWVGPIGESAPAALYYLLQGYDPLRHTLVRGWEVDAGREKLILPYRLGGGRALYLHYVARIPKLNVDGDIFAGSDAAITAVLAYATAEAYRNRERQAITDSPRLANYVRLQSNEMAQFTAEREQARMQLPKLIR